MTGTLAMEEKGNWVMKFQSASVKARAPPEIASLLFADRQIASKQQLILPWDGGFCSLQSSKKCQYVF
jgi:hypothetical protein